MPPIVEEKEIEEEEIGVGCTVSLSPEITHHVVLRQTSTFIYFICFI